MKPRQPTIDSCIDAEDHAWMVVNEDQDIMTGRRWQRRWCRKCGALTQVHITDGLEAVALVNDEGQPHLLLPEVTRLLAKSSKQ